MCRGVIAVATPHTRGVYEYCYLLPIVLPAAAAYYTAYRGGKGERHTSLPHSRDEQKPFDRWSNIGSGLAAEELRTCATQQEEHSDLYMCRCLAR